MSNERIPVSLSKNDFAFLNYIRQGSLYSGKSISSLPEIGDVLKAIIIHAHLSIWSYWERDGLDMFTVFCSENNDGESLKNLPKTQTEFFQRVRIHQTNEILRKLQETNNILNHETENGPDKINTSTTSSRDTNLTNYILTLKDNEKHVLDSLNSIFDVLTKKHSNSGIIRFLLRYYFINPGNDNDKLKNEQFTILSSFYLYGLYGYTPQEAILLTHGCSEFLGIKIDKDKLEGFKMINVDELAFNLYLEQLQKYMNDGQEIKKAFVGKLKVRTLLMDININNELNESHKSVHSDFYFHSSFIGFTLLLLEWYYSQHTLPILTTYLYGKINEIPLNISFFHLGLKRFKDGMEVILNSSKQYKSDEKNLIKIMYSK